MTILPTRSRAAFWALAAVAWLVSHDVVYLAQIGPGEGLARALRDAAHGYWGTLELLLLLLGIGAAGLVALRLLRLAKTARALGADRPVRLAGSYARRVGRTWGALFAIVALAFLVQENIEHLVSHGHVIGTAALVGPEYPLAVPVIALVSFGAALMAAAVGGLERSLVEAIAAVAGHRWGRRTLLRRAPVELGALPSSAVACAAGRGPPSPPVLAFS